MKPTAFPNVQIGTTADKVAAGESLSITTASGEVISATAITAITTNTVAFQAIDGRYMAFDFAVSAVTSRRKEVRRTHPVPQPVVAGIYPFKGLVRFNTQKLYQGGDDNIIQLDTGIPVDDIADSKYYVLGLSNIGANPLQFIAIWRKGDDLITRENELSGVVGGWFLKTFARTNNYLGPDFFGSNGIEWRRELDSVSYDTPTAWGTEFSVLPFTDNIAPAPTPTADAVHTGTENLNSSDTLDSDGPLSYIVTETIEGVTSLISNRSEAFPIISSNYGQALVGTGVETSNFSVDFTIEYYTQWRGFNYGVLNKVVEQLNDSVVGVSSGNDEQRSDWTVFLSKTDIATCSTSIVSNSSGGLTIAYVYGQQSPPPFVGTKQADSISTGDVTNLMLSGQDCYLFSTRTFLENYSAQATHSHDYNYIQQPGEPPVRGNIETTYWNRYREYYDSSWFLTELSESYDLSGSFSIKLKNSRDNTIIECDPNSISIPVYNDTFILGQPIELECAGFARVGINNNAFYDSVEKYTLNYQGRTTRNGQLMGGISVDRRSDDTLHNTIFNGLLSREYDIIWSQDNKLYLADLAIVSVDIEIIEQQEFPRSETAGIPENDPGIFDCVYVAGKVKHIRRVTCIITNKRRINSSMWTSVDRAIIVSRDNYLTYLAIPENADAGFKPRNLNMYLRENPVIAVSSSVTAGDITSNRQMYAEILELLPSGRWVRREQEEGDVTSMSLGTPDTDTDFWSYYKE